MHCGSYMILQCGVSDLRFALCRLCYVLLQCSTEDLQCALSKLHYVVTTFQNR